MATCSLDLPKTKAIAERYLSKHHMSAKEASNYACRLLKNLCTLWQDQLFCDVEIHVGSHTFHAHRNVLAAGSPYFNAMFASTLVENEQKVITLHEIHPDIFQSLLNFFYTGQIEVNSETCQELMSAADMFNVSEVLVFCCEFLKQQLTVENCIGIYIFAEAHAWEDVLEAAERFIYSNFEEVGQSTEFLDLPKETLIHFLNSEHLHVKTELQVLYIALRWLLHDISARRIHLFDVLSPVRFTLIPQNQLRSYLRDSIDSIDLELEKALRVFYHKVYSKRTKTHPRLQTQKNIYIIGGFSRLQGKRWADGETLCSVEKFDTFEIQWKKMPEIEDARSGHGTAVLNQKIYVAGGERDSLICDTVECFDPTNCTWKNVACMNFPRCNLTLCADRQHLYAIGGWIGSELGATIEKYDPAIDQWAVCGRVNTLRYAMGAVEHEEGLFYLIGGADHLGIELKTTECYNPVTKEWCRLSDMPTRRSHVALAVIDEYIYAVGGSNEHQGALNVVEKYCIDTDTWTSIPPMCSPRAGASVVAIDGILYVFGGWYTENHSLGQYVAPTTLYSCECYNPQTTKWTSGPSMWTSRCDAGIAVLL